MMAMDKKCSFGNLVGSGEIFHTTNPLKNEYKWWDTIPATAINCFLSLTKIAVSPGDTKHIFSPLGDTHLCTFRDNQCLLQEGRLVWDSEPIIASKKTCQLIKFSEENGTFADKAWTSNSGEISLTFKPRPGRVEDCAERYAISEQGWAIPLAQFSRLQAKKRKKRQINSPFLQTGSVETPQLAAELTAAQLHMFRNLKETYHQLAFKSCQSEHKKYAAILASDATIAVREMYHNSFLKGEWVYHNILKVQKCIPIANWTARATSDLPGINKCYLDLPVNATFLDGTTRPAFLQTRTMRIRFTSEVGSCEQHRYKSVKVGDRIIVYDQILGKAVRSASITSFRH